MSGPEQPTVPEPDPDPPLVVPKPSEPVVVPEPEPAPRIVFGAAPRWMEASNARRQHEIAALEEAYARRPHREWRRSLWLWRGAMVGAIIVLLLAATTEKKNEPSVTVIEPCALVLTTNGQGCR